MLVLIEGIMNGKGFRGNKWMHWFFQQTESATSPPAPSPISLLPPPLHETALARWGLVGLHCWNSHTAPSVLAVLIMFRFSRYLSGTTALNCNCIESQTVCGLCLEYSDLSLGCLPHFDCLSLEYWASLTPSLQRVWSLSITRIAQHGTEKHIATLARLQCHGLSQNSYTPEPTIGLKCVHSEIILRKLWNVTNSLKQLIKLGI